MFHKSQTIRLSKSIERMDISKNTGKEESEESFIGREKRLGAFIEQYFISKYTYICKALRRKLWKTSKDIVAGQR